MSEYKNVHNSVYQGLTKSHELFHKVGGLNDSNQKLDECLKLLAIHICGQRKEICTKTYQNCLSRETFSLEQLASLFQQIASQRLFKTPDGFPLFSEESRLSFSSEGTDTCFVLFSTLSTVLNENSPCGGSTDTLNEIFGYFVRDNFRNNTEDAQYMTPPEVVDFMVSIALTLVKDNLSCAEEELVVMDPSSGVGSFLKEFYRQSSSLPNNVRYVAQDKVERMGRLTAANFLFSNATNFEVYVGNSLYDGASIDRWNGKVDLILTNPPFGARFSKSEVATRCANNTPRFCNSKSLPATIDSELLFLDRYITLLREGGYCLAVVPDSVVSAQGPSELARSLLLRHAEIMGVIELPPVTFAQAGTRTKTSIVIFRKLRCDVQPIRTQTVFFAEINKVGFEVYKKKGTAIKKLTGETELPEALSAWNSKHNRVSVSDERFSWVYTDFRELDAWTPRSILYQKSRAKLPKASVRPLRELSEYAEKRPLRKFRQGTFFISVLHVIGEGLLDIRALQRYQPVTPGRPVNHGEVLVSRINPRIPRVLVVPELPGEILCSVEFEILVPKTNIDPYALAYSLLTPNAQDQLQSMTAGTSASHARIKPRKILNINVSWSDTDSFRSEMKRHRSNLISTFNHMYEVIERRKRLDVACFE